MKNVFQEKSLNLMQTVVIVIHLLVVIALVGSVLIQRSEGGGLGIGGGSGFMTARGTKNALTRLTAILALCFFVTSIILTVMQLVPGKDGSHILREIPIQGQNEDSNNLLDNLGGSKTGNQNSAGGAQSETVPAPQQNRTIPESQGATPTDQKNSAQKAVDEKTRGEQNVPNSAESSGSADIAPGK